MATMDYEAENDRYEGMSQPPPGTPHNISPSTLFSVYSALIGA